MDLLALFALGTYICKNASLCSGWLASVSMLGCTVAPLANFVRVHWGTTHLIVLYLFLICICTACAFSLEYSKTKNEYSKLTELSEHLHYKSIKEEVNGINIGVIGTMK